METKNCYNCLFEKCYSTDNPCYDCLKSNNTNEMWRPKRPIYYEEQVFQVNNFKIKRNKFNDWFILSLYNAPRQISQAHAIYLLQRHILITKYK